MAEEQAGKASLEYKLEAALFMTRWLAAPVYLGLAFALVMLLIVFFRYLLQAVPQVMTMGLDEAVLTTLTFIDIALLTNLVLIVIFAGYENFVSRMEVDGHRDRPTWLGAIGFSDLKLKLFASIVAITGIELLKGFMAARTGQGPSYETLQWLVIIHVTFLFTGLVSSASDWLSARARSKAG